MFRVFACALLTGCLTINDQVTYDVLADMPELSDSCDADKIDESTETSRLVAAVEMGFEDGPTGGSQVAATCRGRAYARVQAVDWDAVRSQLPGPTNLTWVELVASLDTVEFDSDLFEVPPEGIEVQIEQFVVTEGAELDAIEVDPLTLVDAIGDEVIAGSATHLMRVSHAFDGTETGNLATLVTIETNEVGPLEAVTASFENDEGLQVVTVAEVQVPLRHLGEDPYTVSVDLAAHIDYVARAGLSLFGGGE